LTGTTTAVVHRTLVPSLITPLLTTPEFSPLYTAAIPLTRFLPTTITTTTCTCTEAKSNTREKKRKETPPEIYNKPKEPREEK
jgi:hypothetical protein